MRKSIFTLLLIMFTFSLCAQDVRYLRLVSSVNLDNAKQIAISDDKLIVLNNNEIYHYDTFSPVFPYLKEVYDVNGEIGDMMLIDQKVLVASENINIKITRRDTITTAMNKLNFQMFNGSSLVQEGSNVYIGHSETGLYIEDIRRGSISQYHDTHGILSLAAEWPNVYAVNSMGLETVDIDDIYNPKELGRNNNIFHPRAIQVSGSKCIIGTTNQLVFVDVKDPADPIVTKTIRLNHEVEDIEIKDEEAYIALGLGGLIVYNITDVKKPLRLDDYSTRGFCSDIEIMADYIYVANGNAGVIILKFD